MNELANKRQNRIWQWLHALSQNPVAVKELRSRMRGRRAFVVLTGYLMVMSGLITLVYLIFVSSSGGPFGPDSRDAGKAVFSAVLGMQVILVTFIGPSFTAGTVSGEKERQTYDLLRTTLLTANSFVKGKLVSALSYVLLLILAAIPLQSIAFMLGGISPIELILSQLLILVAAVTFALYGLFCSSIMRTTLAASVTTFAGALFFSLGMPALVLLLAAFLGPLITTSSFSGLGEMILAYGGVILASTNLAATLILSDVFLLEENTLFLFKTSIGGRSVYMFSPWPLFLVIYSLLALILYWICVRRIRRIADK